MLTTAANGNADADADVAAAPASFITHDKYFLFQSAKHQSTNCKHLYIYLKKTPLSQIAKNDFSHISFQ